MVRQAFSARGTELELREPAPFRVIEVSLRFDVPPIVPFDVPIYLTHYRPSTHPGATPPPASPQLIEHVTSRPGITSGVLEIPDEDRVLVGVEEWAVLEARGDPSILVEFRIAQTVRSEEVPPAAELLTHQRQEFHHPLGGTLPPCRQLLARLVQVPTELPRVGDQPIDRGIALLVSSPISSGGTPATSSNNPTRMPVRSVPAVQWINTGKVDSVSSRVASA